MRKKNNVVLTIIILLAFVFNYISTWAYIDTENIDAEIEENEIHIGDLERQKTIAFLSSLGILEDNQDDTLGSDNEVTRAEFCSIIVKMLGLEEIASFSVEKVTFTDVPLEHPAIGSIETAYNIGLVGGKGNNKFFPDDLINYEQATKILISALGYDIVANNKGGYPGGYLILANEIGLFKNIKIDTSSNVTRGVIAQIIFNAIDIDLMQKSGYGEDVKYSVTPGQTILTNKHKINKISGQVTAVGKTSIFGESSLGNDEIAIDRVVFKKGEVKAQNLGHIVTCYVKEIENSGKKTLILMEDDLDEFSKIIVNSKDINSDTSNSVFKYSEEDDKKSKAEEIRISVNANVVYNGKYKSKAKFLSPNDLKPNVGRVTLFEINGDNEYDLIIIESFDTYKVEKVDAGNERLYLSANQTFKRLNGDPLKEYIEVQSDYFNIILEDGSYGTISDIDMDSVLSIAKSIDREVINIYVSNKAVSGFISETDNQGGITVFSDVYTDYHISESFRIINKAGEVINTYNINDSGDFYFDIEGNIAYFIVKHDPSIELAYLYAMATGNSKLDVELEFELLTKSKDWIRLKGAKRIEFDGQSNAPYDLIVKTLRDADGTILQPVIRYKVNDKGEIDFIDTPIRGANENEDSLNAITNKEAVIVDYWSGDNLLDADGYVGVKIVRSTTVLEVPYSEPGEGKAKDLFKFVSNRNLEYTGRYDMSFYDINNFTFTSFVTVTKSAGTAGQFSDMPFVVGRVVNALDENGNPTKKLVGVNAIAGDSRLQEFFISPSMLGKPTLYSNHPLIGEKEVESGDYIRYQLNGAGHITNIYIMFSNAKRDGNYFITNNGQLDEFAYGKVLDFDIAGNYVLIQVGPSSNDKKAYKMRGMALYNTSKKSAEKIAVSRVEKGDEVFLYGRYSQPMNTAFYR